MSRDARRADELAPETYIYIDGDLHLVVDRQPLAEDQLLILANGDTVTWKNDRPVELAPADEVLTAAAVAQATGRGLRNFPGLSPAIGPVREVWGPMYANQSVVESQGCGRCGAVAQVPFGIGLCADCAPLLPLKPPVERDGFAPPSGHAVVLPADALLHDRYDNGGTEAPEFERLEVGMFRAVVCTSLSDEDALARLSDMPSGSAVGWRLTEDPKNQPVPCDDNPATHRHLMFASRVSHTRAECPVAAKPGDAVTCDRCKRTYRLTPSSDFYCAAEGDHCCETCLLGGTPLIVIDPRNN